MVPSRFIVHVSADNRYKLYVNGKLVSLGPARGDIYNWSFETVDLAPYLRKGKNTLASVVWNYAERKPVAQISYDPVSYTHLRKPPWKPLWVCAMPVNVRFAA